MPRGDHPSTLTAAIGDIVVLKLNNSGIYQWNTFYGSASNDYGNGITVDTSGNVYVAGGSSATWGTPLNPHSGYCDIVVLKLNSSGVYQWHTFYGSASDDCGTGIVVDTSGNVYVTGYSQPPGDHPSTLIVVIMTSLYSNSTARGYTSGTPSMGRANSDFGNSIAVDTSGNIYVAGHSLPPGVHPLNPYNGGYDIVVLKLNSSGVYQWHTFYGSAS